MPSAHYYREILDHAGIKAELIENLSDFEGQDVLLLAGDQSLTEGMQRNLLDWVEGRGKVAA